MRDAARRELRPRRTARRTEQLAHLSQRRRSCRKRRRRRVGYLGCDFALEQGAYRIKRILDVAPWDTGVRSPLRGPGVKVKEGDWLLAVNGRKLDAKVEPAAAFQGLADKTVILTVNDKPDARRRARGARADARQRVRAAPLRVDRAEPPPRRRRRPAGASATSTCRTPAATDRTNSSASCARRSHKDGAHHRRTLELRRPDSRSLHRAARTARSRTTGACATAATGSTPFVAHDGPKVMLANRLERLGRRLLPVALPAEQARPVIGTRTWGGLIGMTGCPPLIDGGSVTVPTFSIYDTNGKWIIEGYGVEPDIEVLDDPAAARERHRPAARTRHQGTPRPAREESAEAPREAGIHGSHAVIFFQ